MKNGSRPAHNYGTEPPPPISDQIPVLIPSKIKRHVPETNLQAVAAHKSRTPRSERSNEGLADQEVWWK